MRDELNLWLQFVRGQSHILIDHPVALFQQAANELCSSPPEEQARLRIENGIETRPWVRWVNRPDTRGPCLLTIARHPSRVSDCAFLPDARRVISISSDSVYVWNVVTGNKLLQLVHESPVTACACSSDGQRIVSAAYDGKLRVWNADNGETLLTLTGHSAPIAGCAMSPDGTRIVSTAENNTASIWNVETAEVITEIKVVRPETIRMLTFAREQEGLTRCSYSPDGKSIAFGSEAVMGLHLRNAETGATLRTFGTDGRIPNSVHEKSVTACAFAPDGKRVVSASRDGTLKVWDVATGTLVLSLIGHSQEVVDCAYAPDGQRIVSASWDQTLKIWDANNGAVHSTLVGHSDAVTACAFSSDGHRIVSASWDKTVKVWNADITQQVSSTSSQHSGEVTSCLCSPDRQRIVSASRDGTLMLWDSANGQPIATLAGHSGEVMSVACDPNSKRIVSASRDNTLRLWDATTGASVTTFTGHTEEVRSCAYAPDGRLFASCSWDKTVRIWDPETATAAGLFEGHEWKVYDCAFSPDGRRLVSASTDKTAKVWDAATGKLVVTLAGFYSAVTSCAYSPCGRQILTVAPDNAMWLWNADSGEKVAYVPASGGWIYDSVYSPDGNLIAIADGGRLRLFTAAAADATLTLRGHEGIVRACAFSPCNRWLLSVSDDKTLKVWDIASGEVKVTFYDEGLLSLALGRKGMAATGSTNGLVHLLRFEGLEFGPASVTLTRVWQFEKGSWWSRFGGREGQGRWASELTVVCFWCGKRSTPPQGILDLVLSLSGKNSDDSRLLSSCPACHGALRFNPFIVDNQRAF